MALPVLETAKYETLIPSTGKRIEFRPFLVKEEKILFMAQESDDPKQIVKALKDVIRVCTFEKVNIDELAIYDLEYLFLQLRSKSVGENIELNVKCEKCEKINNIAINLNDVNIKYPEVKVDPRIKLNDSVGVVLHPFPVKEIENVGEKAEDIIKTIASCIESIYDDSNVYDSKNVSRKELIEFVESFSRSQLNQIEEFISNQPKLSHEIGFVCHECSTNNKQTLEGLMDFFG